MLESPTTIHIRLFAAFGAFTVSCLSIVLGYLLIQGGMFVPGLGFSVFGAAISWKALGALIKIN